MFDFIAKHKENKRLVKELTEQYNRESQYEMQKPYIDYCNLYQSSILKMLEKIKSHGFNFDVGYGYEFRQTQDSQCFTNGEKYNWCYIFEFPENKILFFNDNAKQLLYLEILGGTYKRYADNLSSGREDVADIFQYNYHIIQYSDIFKAEMKVNNSTTMISTTNTDGKDMLSRGVIGGLLLGDAGMVIGSTTAKKNTQTTSFNHIDSIELKICTVDVSCPNISLTVINVYNPDHEICLAKDGLLSNEKLTFSKESVRRPRISTTTDIKFSLPGERIWCLAHVQETMGNIADKFDFIIQNNKIDEVKNMQTNNPISEIVKLTELKEKGLITDEEFTNLKQKLI